MNASEILHAHNLKRTSCREGIIEVMAGVTHALSENEIRNSLTGNYDRTTFYRSFKALIEKGIIHKVVVDSTVIRYALNYPGYNPHVHAHFYCLQCSNLVCIEQDAGNAAIAPEGFQVMDAELILKGKCKNCLKLNKN